MSRQNQYLNVSWTDPDSRRSQDRSELTPISFGRRDNNTIVLEGELISRQHARLDFVDGKIILSDLDSINGTQIKGRTIRNQRVVLKPGDQFTVGKFTISVDLDSQRGAQNQFNNKGKQVTCSNPECRRPVSIQYLDCPWCGYALPGGTTIR